MNRIVVMALLVFSFVVTPFAQASMFVDTQFHPHAAYIDQLAELGIVEGYGFGIFRPDIPINRAEFLKILMLAVYGKESLDVYNKKCFREFTGGEQWFWPHACTAKERGIINGYPDGTFRGTQAVNLAEALKMAIEAWGIPKSDQVYANEYWYVPYFEVAAVRGLFQYFKQSGNYLLTRSDMAYLIISMGERVQDVSEPEQSSSVSSVSSASSQITGPTCGNGVLDPGEECEDGNTEDSDGCSSLCILVPEPVHHGAMRIEQRPTSAFSVSTGMDDVILFVFDAIAGRQDVAITNLTFRAQNGNLESASNYRISTDSDGDGIADLIVGTATADDGVVSFDGLSITVPDGASVRIELKADILSTAPSGSFSVEFALDDSRFIQAVGLIDTRDLTGIELNGAACTESSICWISVNTRDNPTFDILGRGNLFITADSVSVRSQQLLGGQTSPDLLRIKFRADGEDILVEKIKLKAEEAVFTQLLLYEEGSSFPLATAWTSECAPAIADQFCARTSLTIEQSQEKTIIVRGVVKSDQQGITSGNTAIVILESDPAIAMVEARGTSSQEDLTFNDGDISEDGEVFIGRNDAGPDQDITGPTHDIVLAKIASIENANSDSDGSAVPTGTTSFGVLRFRAAENNNTQDGRNIVTIQKLTFNVGATNVEFLTDSFKLYNLDDAAKVSDCSADAYTGQITVTCSSLQDSLVSTSINSGESISLALRGFVTNPQVSAGTSTLQASIQSLGDRNITGTVEWDDGITTSGWVDIEQVSVRSTAYQSD